MATKTILLVENQVSQFRKVIGLLERDHSVYPEEKDYIEFIDHVRVWVNEQYESHLREVHVIAYLVNVIEKNNCGLILMDYILGGACHCLTGIDLATKINSVQMQKGSAAIPVIFLSKIQDNDKRVMTQYGNYKALFANCDWIHKGYFGEELLEPEYFKRHVSAKIEKLLAKHDIKIPQGLSELTSLMERKQSLTLNAGGLFMGSSRSYEKLQLLVRKLDNISAFSISIDAGIKELLASEAAFGTQKFDELVDHLLKIL